MKIYFDVLYWFEKTIGLHAMFISFLQWTNNTYDTKYIFILLEDSYMDQKSQITNCKWLTHPWEPDASIRITEQ